MEHLPGTILLLACWAGGTVVAYLLYKIGLQDHKSRADQTKLSGKFEGEAESIATTYKHYRLTFFITCGAIIIAFIVPFKLIRWLCAIAVGMTLPPVFYDVFYNCLPNTANSKLNACLTGAAAINFILMVLTLSILYWSYIHVVF